MRGLLMNEFPSWEGQGVGSFLKLHIALPNHLLAKPSTRRFRES